MSRGGGDEDKKPNTGDQGAHINLKVKARTKELPQDITKKINKNIELLHSARLALLKVKPSGSESQLKYEKMQGNDEDDELEEEDEDGHGYMLCRACGENYASDEFWICCDICERASYVFCMKAQEQDDSWFEGWCKDESKDEDLIARISCNTRGVIESGYQTFKTLCLLNYALMIRHDYDITSSLRRGALQLWYPEPGYETVGSKDLTCEDWMVNTRTDADLSAAVQNALQGLLTQIRAKIREEFRTSSRPSDAGG
nr:PHD finger protein ALFIN-LIKE 4 [Tanacetum cinerariifolium]